MARLVSLTVSLAVDAVTAGEVTPGVSATPDTLATAQSWLERLEVLGERIQYRDYLAD